MKYGFLNIKDRVMMIEDEGPGSALAPGMLDSVSSFAEKAGLPDMNVTLNYENPTNNGIALVTKALMYLAIQDLESGELTDEEIAVINDILYNPGYAPMERLVRAYVYYDPKDVDPYAPNSEYVVDFANDWERLAFAICPDMFEKPRNAVHPGELSPLEPDPNQGQDNQ